MRIFPFGGSAAMGEEVALSAREIGLRSGHSELTGVLDPQGGLRLGIARSISLFRSPLKVAEGSRWLVETDEWSPGVVSWARSLAPLGREGWWLLDLNDVLGEIELSTPAGPLPMTVCSWKLDDELEPTRSLEVLLAEVWERHLALSRRLGRAPSVELPAGRRRRAPFQTLMLLDRLLHADGVAEAWDALVSAPPSALRIDRPIVSAALARNPILHGAKGPWRAPDGIDSQGQVQRVFDRRPVHSFRTPAALLAVKLAHWIEEASSELLGMLHAEAQGAELVGPERTWARRARAIQERATSVMATPAFADLDPFAPLDMASPALTLNRTCQPMLRAWSVLQDGVGHDGRGERLFRDPLKESFDLYEYWCWFALWDAVVSEMKPLSPKTHWAAKVERVVSDERSLEHGLHARVQVGGTVVELWYNATASTGKNAFGLRSYSLSLRPDLLMRITNGDEVDIIVFDAKYRVDLVTAFDTEEDEEKRFGRAKTSDIKVMHGYRDALTFGGEQAHPRWVLSLFPGTEARLFADGGGTAVWPRGHLSTLACPSGGVGAIPAAPGSVELLRECVKGLLRGVTREVEYVEEVLDVHLHGVPAVELGRADA